MNEYSSSDHTEPDLTLLPEAEVRGRLEDRPLALVVLRPPFAALGVGALRVLRIEAGEKRTEIVAGYERYERLPA